MRKSFLTLPGHHIGECFCDTKKQKAGFVPLVPFRSGFYLYPFETVPIFSFVTYSSDGLSPFPSYLKLVLQPYVKSGSRLLPMLKKKPALLIIHERSRTSTAPSAFPAGCKVERCGLYLLLLNRKGFTPKARLASLLTA